MTMLVSPLLFLLTDGRAGAVIGVLEVILLSLIYNRRLIIKIVPITVVIGIFLFFLQYNSENIRSLLSNAVTPISPRVSAFILAEEGTEGDLSHDRSWLTRQLMIEKGLEIIKIYPILGVGPLNFINYEANLSNYYSNEKYQRLAYRLDTNKTDLNTTSAHNAYIQMVSEYGVLGFLVIIFIE
jgi:O-antigen ligase